MLLMRPKLLSLKNGALKYRHSKTAIFRDLIILILALFTAYGIFYGTGWGLKQIRELSDLAYLSPFIPLSIVLLALHAMLFLTAFMNALGSLYLSQDLSLILSKPVGPTRFFISKFIDILLSSAWMPLIFILPFLFAYGVSYGAGEGYYLLSLLLLVPYFSVPVLISIIISVLFAAFIPARRTRELIFVFIISLLFMVYSLTELLSLGLQHKDNIIELFRILTVISFPQEHWLPSHWVAKILSLYLEGSSALSVSYIVLLFSVVFSLFSLAYILLTAFHKFGYNKASNTHQGINPAYGKARMNLMDRLFFFHPAQKRALYLKEYRLFFREVTQSIQLLLLLGIYSIYLYNVRIFRGFDVLPPDMKISWKSFLYLANIGMGTFVTIALTSRLVFPSISLEGRAFYLLRSAPIKLIEILKIKFWAWYIPVGAVASFIFAAGSYAIEPDTAKVTINFFSGWIVSFGTIGIAIGLGAIFANFNWEHPSQLIASFGSLIFMLFSILFLLFNLIPIAFFSFYTVRSLVLPGIVIDGRTMSRLIALVIIFFLNILTAKIAIRLGEYSLERHEK